MKTILVPTDFSKSAENALGYAIGLAKKENARLILINAFQISYLYYSAPFPVQFLNDEIARNERASNRRLRLRCEAIYEAEKIKCEYVSKLGQATDVILEAVRLEKPDLVVMGTQGAKGFKGMILGSNATRVIGKAKCPVIAVPGKTKYHEIRKIIYATDFRENSIAPFKELFEIGALFNAHIDVVHIHEEAASGDLQKSLQKVKDKIEKRFGYKDITFRLIHAENTEEELKKISRKKSHDLLVMSMHHGLFFNYLSTTKKVAAQSQIPIFAIPV